MSIQPGITIRIDDEVLSIIRERQAELQLGSARNVSVSEALRDLLTAPEKKNDEG